MHYGQPDGFFVYGFMLYSTMRIEDYFRTNAEKSANRRRLFRPDKPESSYPWASNSFLRPLLPVSVVPGTDAWFKYSGGKSFAKWSLRGDRVVVMAFRFGGEITLGLVGSLACPNWWISIDENMIIKRYCRCPLIWVGGSRSADLLRWVYRCSDVSCMW